MYKMKIQELRNSPFPQRLLYFFLTVAVWFFISYQINTSYSDAIKKSENLRILWILSTILIAVLVNIFFKKNKQNTEEKTE
jgi:surface polysaccharide O-acyltransferase-like enzyme